MGHYKYQTPKYCHTNTNGKEGSVGYFSLIWPSYSKIPVPKGRTVTGNFYKNVVLIKIEELLQKSPPQNRTLVCPTFAPAHRARIVTDVLETEKVTVLPHPPYSPDLAPCDYFSFQNLNIIYLEGDTILEMPLCLLFISD